MNSMLTQPFPRLWSLEAGVAMVVTDLHGDWDAYRRYRDHFVALQAKRQADWFVLTGDLIHRENPNEPDLSLEMALDVLALRASYGQAIIYLCGNHELPHIYGISLVKGNRSYTPAFEAALTGSGQRAEIIALFDALPFYLRTRAGVTLTHAGAAAPLASLENAIKIFNWSHQRLLERADQTMAAEDVAALRSGYAKWNQMPYETMAQHYLAVTGPDDPRYNDLLRGFLATSNPTFEQLLWPVLFNRCEQEYGLADYVIFLESLLQEVSQDFYPQRVLVAGHMTIKGGYQIVAQRHLRLASAHHATPREAGRYLLFDAGRDVKGVEGLLLGLGSVYR